MSEKFCEQFSEHVNGRSERLHLKHEERQKLIDEMDFKFLNSKIMFGKHKGIKYNSLDNGYINWLIKNSILKDENQTKNLDKLLKLKRIDNDIYYLGRDPYD
jgi:hypothetical protein